MKYVILAKHAGNGNDGIGIVILSAKHPQSMEWMGHFMGMIYFITRKTCIGMDGNGWQQMGMIYFITLFNPHPNSLRGGSQWEHRRDPKKARHLDLWPC